MKNRVIEQKYRFQGWPLNHYATATYVIKELGQEGEKKEIISTSKLFVVHDGIPSKDLGNVIQFWEKFWKRFRTPKGGIASSLPPKTSNASFLGNLKKIKGKSD